MKARIAVLGGDGIGPEVTAEALRVLQAVADRFGHEFEFAAALIGGAAIDASGSALPPRTIDACRESAATLLGAVGGPKWSDPGARVRPDIGADEFTEAAPGDSVTFRTAAGSGGSIHAALRLRVFRTASAPRSIWAST